MQLEQNGHPNPATRILLLYSQSPLHYFFISQDAKQNKQLHRYKIFSDFNYPIDRGFNSIGKLPLMYAQQ